MSAHRPTLGPDGYVRCPACPAFRAGPFGPQQLLSAGLAQAGHSVVATFNDAFLRNARTRRAVLELPDLPPTMADVAADERAKLQGWWKREADAMWTRHGLERPKS